MEDYDQMTNVECGSLTATGFNASDLTATGSSFNVPKYNWKVKLTDNTWWMQETTPNWFHRKMCALILGVKWVKL